MNRRVRRRPTFAALVLGAACLTAVSGPTGPAAASGSSAPPASLSGWNGESDCTLLQPTKVWKVNPDGSPLGPDATAAQKAAAGTEYQYDMGDGTTMTTVDPPPGFNPSTADAQTNRTFGYDRPTDAAALALWQETYAGYQGTIRSVPCVGNAHDGLRGDHRRFWGRGARATQRTETGGRDRVG